MPVKIRLQRHGKKHQPFYHIVVADGRAPRDGNYIEKIGTYNPGTNPATIDLNFDKAISWLQNGAQPTDTTKAILAYKGVMYKNHLLKGMAKKALTAEQVETKFAKWLSEKEAKINNKKETVTAGKQSAYTKRIAAEAEAKVKKAGKIASKNAPPVAEAPVAETPTAETPATE